MRPLRPKPLCHKSLLLLSCAALAGCGGAGEDGGGDVFTIFANPGGSGVFGSYYMATITQEWRDAAASFRLNSPRFTRQDETFTINGTPVFGNPLQSSRVDYAHALGLSGAGQVIAIVDDGFRQTHETFAGKSNTSTGSPGQAGHGTMVASVAAGNSGSMVGVAPGANLIFSDWGYNPATRVTTLSDLTAAANAARTGRAVAQNNSWGYTNSPVGTTSFNATFGSTEGTAWLNALRLYALGAPGWSGGVVVFAVDNDDTGSAGILDALPSITGQTDLERGWIAVGNAIPVFNDNDVTAVASLESSPCYQSGRWCLMADGAWVGASAASNTAYQSRTGSSFAAPQVSGALALLAEAFPNLTPHQLRARLLASADNTFSGFSTTGTLDLDDSAGVLNHNWSSVYGHGFLDIRAALLPIGQTGLSLNGGEVVSPKDYAFATGGAMGDAVTRSLEGIDLAVSDQLGGDFTVAAKAFATEAAPTALAETLAARTLTKDFATTRTARLNPLADTFAAHPGQSMDLTAADGLTKASVLVGAEDYGLALARTVAEGELTLDVGVKLARDSGGLMGFSGSGDSGGATMAALTVSLSHDVGDGGFFALSGEMGIADLATPAAIARADQASFNSLKLDVGSRSVFAKGDRLSLGLGLPMAVSAGSADMTVPVRLADGGTEVRAVGIDLAPEERQMEISISYQVPMSDASELMFEVVHAENYGNIAGMTDSAAVLGLKWSF